MTQKYTQFQHKKPKKGKGKANKLNPTDVIAKKSTNKSNLPNTWKVYSSSF